ncbi:MAG: AMIN domain-containing protein [Sulfurimonas sp. RIFOXYD12_FULL_36_11]|nr:MAG: AMIN domain-containing protein [Sulfurimonas sp. RIFOXYD12_FULL_36_11]OHE18996.1 MAG: AMIN domain-containing protein [Sulfurimonas sp. RIFOXYD2_FULL_37_8]
MIRILFISAILLLTLNARENPFFPSEGEKDLPISSNENRNKEPLKRVAITLPAQARVLQKVILEFKNLDGTIENKSIELDNSVDWHLPVFVSQTFTETQKATSSDKAEDVPAKNKTKQKESGYATIASIKELSILSSGKCLKIVTNDEIMRNFLLVAPHRIVMDFKKDIEIDIKNSIKTDEQNIFKDVRIGNHDGYYRVVVELDGYYRYDFKKISNGYQIELK